MMYIATLLTVIMVGHTLTHRIDHRTYRDTGGTSAPIVRLAEIRTNERLERLPLGPVQRRT